jgi:DedD protein
MNSLLNDDEDELDQNERELTLSTATILGIFFGLILLCGLFFGFGYKMGTRKPIPVAQTITSESSTASAPDFGSFKPAAGSPVGSGPSGTPTRIAPVSPGSSDVTSSSEKSTAAPVIRQAPPTAHNAPTTEPTPVPQAATGSYVVQIAAVSHQEDAELLVNALRAKGYPVSAHSEPQDKFFHIQVGPFTNRKDADTAKQRLIADGYQPIVK